MDKKRSQGFDVCLCVSMSEMLLKDLGEPWNDGCQVRSGIYKDHTAQWSGNLNIIIIIIIIISFIELNEKENR